MKILNKVTLRMVETLTELNFFAEVKYQIYCRSLFFVFFGNNLVEDLLTLHKK